MKKSILLSITMALALGFTSALKASDLLYNEPLFVSGYNWAGPYAGIEAGGSWSAQRWTAAGGVSTGNFTGSGGFAGGTLGYNWQNGKWVLGVEGDLSWADISAVDTTTGGCGVGTPCNAQINWFGTFRVRGGYVQDNFLLYLTGGAAVAEIQNSQVLLSPLATATTTTGGFAVGAGGEMALTKNLSAKLEYLYLDFGQTPFCPAAGCGVTVVSDYTRAHIVRAGLSYKF
jgi:outer membrane immunogenic protein